MTRISPLLTQKFITFVFGTMNSGYLYVTKTSKPDVYQVKNTTNGTLINEMFFCAFYFHDNIHSITRDVCRRLDKRFNKCKINSGYKTELKVFVTKFSKYCLDQFI